MKLIPLLFILLSINCWALVDLKADLPSEIQAGQPVFVKASILKLEGSGNELSSLKGQTLNGEVYVHHVGLVERNESHPNGAVELGLIFLKTVDKYPISTTDGSVRLFLSPIKVAPIEAIKEYILIDWRLPFEMPWWVYAAIAFFLGLGAYIYKAYPDWKKKKDIRKTREEMWKKLLEAQSEKDIMEIWNQRLEYFEHFPDVQKNFRQWEKGIYNIIFKPSFTEDEVVKIQKGYKKFVSDLPIRRDYGV